MICSHPSFFLNALQALIVSCDPTITRNRGNNVAKKPEKFKPRLTKRVVYDSFPTADAV
jgi:hypothetical protein